MGPVIADDDSSDDEVPLAQRMKQEAATPKAVAVKKPVAKGKIKMKMKKPAKKKPAKKVSTGPVREKKVYDLPGQKKDTPEEGESLRKFYVSMRTQVPESVMAEQWLMEHGLLPEDEAAKAYKKFLIRKGRDPKKAGAMKKSGGASKPSKPRPKPSVKKEAKSPAVKKVGGIKRKAALDDDDSDSDIPLAALKSNNGGSGFKIPKKE